MPFNQSAVDDSNNPAWDFADGVFGTNSSDFTFTWLHHWQPIYPERVNIVNGNGYYNLYKPDGTYLFTLTVRQATLLEMVLDMG